MRISVSVWSDYQRMLASNEHLSVIVPPNQPCSHDIIIQFQLFFSFFFVTECVGIVTLNSVCMLGWESLYSLFAQSILIYLMLLAVCVHVCVLLGSFPDDALFSQWQTGCHVNWTGMACRQRGTWPLWWALHAAFPFRPSAKKHCVALGLDHSGWTLGIKYLARTLSCSRKWPREPSSILLTIKCP